MERKPNWAVLYGFIFLIAAGMAASFAFGLSPAWEHRLIDGGLVLIPLLTIAWMRGNRGALMLDGAERAGIYKARTHEPFPISWSPRPRRASFASVSATEVWDLEAGEGSKDR